MSKDLADERDDLVNNEDLVSETKCIQNCGQSSSTPSARTGTVATITFHCNGPAVD